MCSDGTTPHNLQSQVVSLFLQKYQFLASFEYRKVRGHIDMLMTLPLQHRF